jgi:DNA-binding MarR family transcriptional regulator
MAAAAGIALAEIAGCTCQRLRRAARRASQIYDAHMAEIGLTGAQFALLAHLYAAEQRGAAATIGRLADAAGMDPTTLTRNLKPLERDGLAAREADPEDRRARRLRLTPLGQSRFAAGTVRWRNAQDDLVRRLGDEVAGRLDAALIAAMAGLEGGDESP